MAEPVSFPGDVIIGGNARINGSIQPLKDRDEVLALVELAPYTVPMGIWRKHDAYTTFLTGSPAADDLGLIQGTFATGCPSLQTDDFGANGAATAYYARAEIPLPAEYVAGQSIEFRIHAGMLTAVADQSCTVDVEVYKSDEDGTSTGDLCADAAVSDNMNSLVFADIDFTITPTTLSPGDLLDVRLTVTADDDATPVCTACIGAVQLLCDTR